jgi:hypothetical protein
VIENEEWCPKVALIVGRFANGKIQTSLENLEISNPPGWAGAFKHLVTISR